MSFTQKVLIVFLNILKFMVRKLELRLTTDSGTVVVKPLSRNSNAYGSNSLKVQEDDIFIEENPDRSKNGEDLFDD